MYSGPVKRAAGQDLHGSRTSCKDQGLFMAIKARICKASRVKTPPLQWMRCGGWYLAACVVPVKIVKDIMIMGHGWQNCKHNSLRLDLTTNWKIMFGFSRSRNMPVQNPISMCINAVYANALTGAKMKSIGHETILILNKWA